MRSKKKRLWNKKDYCFFCDTEVLKFSRHITRHHEAEIEVQEILSYSVGSKKRKILFNKLRNKGNFLKSCTNDRVVPVRKPLLGELEPATISSYLPCKFCKGFYKRKFLYRHVKKCPHNTTDTTERINAQTEGQSLFSTYSKSDILRKEVFPKMRSDTISFTAKTDNLICAVAERYLKSHRDKQFLLVASRKMRQLASLLIEIKKKINVKNLLGALDPINFDTIVKCTKIIAKYDTDNESYGAPSLAANMGTQLKECIDVAYSIELKSCSTESENMKKLKVLKELISSEWQYEISTLANKDLQQKKWNKPSLIPLAEDLTLLKSYLNIEGEKFRDILQQDQSNEKAFRMLQEICYVQLILLNRRRVGELQRMTVNCYTTNINNQISTEFDSCISESEKILMKAFKRIVIKGKRGRGVPVLFTEDMSKNIELLLSLRDKIIKQKNVYLFANTKSANSISGTNAVYKHVRLAGAKNVAALTSTKLRKHLATMSQVINLSKQDLEQLANFMGHTSDIHKTYYRLPSDIYQMAKVSKLLLLNERGEAAKYKGKSLDEINLDLDVEEHSDDDCNGAEIPEQQNNTDVANISQTNEEECLIRNTVPRRHKKRTLEPWTKLQRDLVLSHFKSHLNKKLPPKKHECIELQEKHKDVFVNKSWPKIKIFVVNTYNKMK
ncbi:uncharacterized protein [Diabrotica undecimpunctata]|uniref:uncharacterized protein n=1 Tax=Diabrotica undecimpunctata TaxID=50387 RepID=UPI003B63549B